MATRNINLTDALDRFVAEKVESGAYQNASEVVRAGLRLLDVQERLHARKLAALQQAVQQGLDSLDRGDSIEVGDLDSYFDRLEAEVRAEIKAEEQAAAK